MRLVDLEPMFLKIIDDKTFRMIDSIADADGVQFLCPACFRKNGGNRGTHSIICWKPHVPQTFYPVPGRWNMQGTAYADLTLFAGSSSIHLTGPGCGAHFHITNGQIPEIT